MQLFGKSCVLAKAENAQTIMELWRSILEKFHACSQLSIGLFRITKLPFNKAHSRLSSLLSTLPSPCCYKHSATRLSPVYHHNPFQHLIIQTQNQQNQTKNNSKSTQTALKNPSQTQIKINPKQNQLKIKPKIHRKSTQN